MNALIHRPSICRTAVVSSLLLAAGPLAATDIPLTNAGFETTTGTAAYPQATGWNTSTLTALHSAFPKADNGTLGTRFGFATPTNGPASQTVPVALAANTTYTFKGSAVENGNNIDLRFQIGYNVGSTFVELAGTTYDLNTTASSAWTLLNGVSYTTSSTGPDLGKNIIVRLISMGSISAHGVWFDNVSLDATALTVAPFQVTIMPNATNPGTFDFSWNSQPGMVYDLLSSTELATAPATWTIYNDGVNSYGNMSPSGTGTNSLTGVLPSGPVRFFTIAEKEGPP